MGQGWPEFANPIGAFSKPLHPYNSADAVLARVSGLLQLLLPVKGLVELAALTAQHEQDLAKATTEIQGLSGRLANPRLAGKGPPGGGRYEGEPGGGRSPGRDGPHTAGGAGRRMPLAHGS